MSYRTRIDGPVAYLTLTKGYVAVIDTADVLAVGGYLWCALIAKRTVYAVRRKAGKFAYLHRELLHVPDGMYCDHKNRSGLDNRRENLRIATPSQNGCNRIGVMSSVAKTKGVAWHRGARKWSAQIVKDRKIKYLGLFHSIEEAHLAYAKASEKLHGTFGRLSEYNT